MSLAVYFILSNLKTSLIFPWRLLFILQDIKRVHNKIMAQPHINSLRSGHFINNEVSAHHISVLSAPHLLFYFLLSTPF